MSTDPKWAGDGAVSSEPHTDPMLPVITDDMLPPLANPRVPTLDDRTLAQLLAELEGDENALLGADPNTGPAPDDDTDPLDPVEALERARPKGPVRVLGGPPALPPGPPALPPGPSALPPGPKAQAQPSVESAAPSTPPPAQLPPAQPRPTQSRPTQPPPARPMDEPEPRSR